jgi:hypothetical protein
MKAAYNIKFLKPRLMNKCYADIFIQPLNKSEAEEP